MAALRILWTFRTAQVRPSPPGERINHFRHPLRAEKSVSVPRRHRFLSPPRLPPEGWKFFNAGRFRKNRKSCFPLAVFPACQKRMWCVSFHAAKKVFRCFTDSSGIISSIRSYARCRSRTGRKGYEPLLDRRAPLSFQPPACLSTETEKACRRSNARKCPPKPL